MQLRLLATGEFPGATCSICRSEGKELVTKKLDLSPKAPQIVTLSPDPKAPVDVTVRTAKGGGSGGLHHAAADSQDGPAAAVRTSWTSPMGN